MVKKQKMVRIEQRFLDHLLACEAELHRLSPLKKKDKWGKCGYVIFKNDAAGFAALKDILRKMGEVRV